MTGRLRAAVPDVIPATGPAAILDLWRKATAEATPGPWSIAEKHGQDITDEHWSDVRIKDAEGGDVAATFISHLLEPGNSAQDEVFIVTARTAIPLLVAAVERVMDLHRGITDGDYPESLALCDECGEWAPCPTVRAITAALTGKDAGDELA